MFLFLLLAFYMFLFLLISSRINLQKYEFAEWIIFVYNCSYLIWGRNGMNWLLTYFKLKNDIPNYKK